MPTEIIALIALVSVCCMTAALGAWLIAYILRLQARFMQRLAAMRAQRDEAVKRAAQLAEKLKRKKDPYAGGGWK